MISGSLVNYLTMGCWNIEGIYEKVNGVNLSKFDEPTFLNRIMPARNTCTPDRSNSKI